jgi:hypothetical protein
MVCDVRLRVLELQSVHDVGIGMGYEGDWERKWLTYPNTNPASIVSLRKSVMNGLDDQWDVVKIDSFDLDKKGLSSLLSSMLQW